MDEYIVFLFFVFCFCLLVLFCLPYLTVHSPFSLTLSCPYLTPPTHTLPCPTPTHSPSTCVLLSQIPEGPQWDAYTAHWMREAVRMNVLARESLCALQHFDLHRRHFSVLFSAFFMRQVPTEGWWLLMWLLLLLMMMLMWVGVSWT